MTKRSNAESKERLLFGGEGRTKFCEKMVGSSVAFYYWVSDPYI